MESKIKYLQFKIKLLILIRIKIMIRGEKKFFLASQLKRLRFFDKIYLITSC